MVEYHHVFCTLWDGTWTRLSVFCGLDVGDQSADLHDRLTLILWTVGCAETQRLWCTHSCLRRTRIKGRSRKYWSGGLSETRNFWKTEQFFCPEELTVMLKCMETTQSTWYTDNTSATHNTAGILLPVGEVYASFKYQTLFFFHSICFVKKTQKL